jgi:sugar phosphate isomerase/epimerase
VSTLGRPTLAFETIAYAPQFCAQAPALEEQISAAAAVGFQAVALDLFSLSRFSDSGGELAKLSRHIGACGLEIAGLATLLVDNNTSVRAAAAALDAVVDRFGPPVVITVFRASPSPKSVDRLGRIAEGLARKGCRVAIEFVAFGQVQTLAASIALAEQIGSDAGICLDAWHLFRGPSDWSELLDVRAEQIAYVQVADALPAVTNDLYYECTRRRAMCGEGELPLASFVKALTGTQYKGTVGLEILSESYDDLSCYQYAHRLVTTGAALWP